MGCTIGTYSLVVKVEGHSMANEVLGARLKSELFIHLFHTILVKIKSCTKWTSINCS